MRNTLRSLLWMCFVAAVPVRAADVVAPDVLAKNVTEEVLAILRADKDIQAGDLGKATELIETKILPHFNFPHITRLAMGRHWAQASPAQRKTLTSEFRTLLVHTYTASLTLYRGQSIDYRPLKLGPEDTDVIVKSVVRQAYGEPIAVDYAMEKTESGWKVYDVKIAGVSLIANYRSAFSAEIEKSGSIDGLIKALAEKNQALAEKNKALAEKNKAIGARLE